MGIPLAGGMDGGPGGSDADEADGADGRTGFDALDFDGEVGDVTDGLRPISHSVYETSGGVGLGLLVENAGPGAFERVEVRVSVTGGGAADEFTAASGAELGRLAPSDRWWFWVPFGREVVAVSDATLRYTVDLEAV